MKIKLKQTCMACPEQYDAFDEYEHQVGYLRLRHGYFRVDFSDCGGETIYDANTKGDGCFYDEEERKFHLEMAKKAIKLKIQMVE